MLFAKMLYFLFFLYLCFTQSLTKKEEWNHEKYDLPDIFRFGVSTSAYQIEGAWNVDGKGESIWDRYLHTHPEAFADGPNGDEACDSYHNYKRDVEMLRELGVDYYRFSISWSRVLPSGLANKINYKGLEYYRNLTEELYKYRIEPMATMYHNDLPQALQDLGGWTNPNIVQWFEDYARILYAHLTKVKYWIPIHEPSVCFQMYDGDAKMAPNIDSKGFGDYKCVKNMLLAHAKAYRLYEKEYKETNITNNFVGLALSLNWGDALNYNISSKKLNESVKLFREFTIDLYLHPIYSKEGDFPKSVKKIVARNSKLEGLEKSRLPELTKEEIKLIKGTSDFIGINHYTSYFVDLPRPGRDHVYPQFPIDINVEVSQSDMWMRSKTSGIRSCPYGLYRLCVYLNQRYKRPPLVITEFGWSTAPGRRDTQRVEVMVELLKAVIYALIDDSDLRGITIFSLMDTIQWTAGATERYGLYEVDFNSTAKTRTSRLSAHYFRQLIDTHQIKEKWQPYNKDLTIGISPKKAAERQVKEL